MLQFMGSQSRTRLSNRTEINTCASADGTSRPCLTATGLQCLRLNSFAFLKQLWGFPGGSVVKNPPAHAEDTASIPSMERFHILQSN